MAAGTQIILDDVDVMLGTVDVSGYCRQVMLHIEHPERVVPFTMGRMGQDIQISRHYMWNVTFDFVTDGWGANTIDAIVTAAMPPPLGAVTTTTTGRLACELKPTSVTVSADNPSYSGTLVVSQWDPLGGGQTSEMVTQVRTFNGTGALTKATS